jgi:hypothetical protein
MYILLHSDENRDGALIAVTKTLTASHCGMYEQIVLFAEKASRLESHYKIVTVL